MIANAAAVLGEGRAGLARRRTGRKHSLSPSSRRATPPICSDLICDRDTDPLEAVDRVPQNLQHSFRLARYLHFPHDPARVIHNADACLLDRYVQSSKMVHAALLLLMLEAVTTDLVSPSA